MPTNKYIFYILTIAFFVSFSSLVSQIITDGTLGSSISFAGKDVIIYEHVGKRSGANLFHSFQEFNIGEGEKVTFTGSHQITTIISRVTGNNPSHIQGTLASTIEHFYLLNPAGIFFGSKANINVKGSFHVSTSDYIGFDNEERFYAQPIVGEILSVSPPSTFGFLPHSAEKTRESWVSFEEVTLSDGLDILSITSQNIVLDQSHLTARELHITAIREGEVSVEGKRDVADSGGGTIHLTNSTIHADSTTLPGVVRLYGNNIIVDNSIIRSQNNMDGGGGIILAAEEKLVIQNASIIDGSSIGDAKGGTIDLRAPTITIERTAILTDGSITPNTVGDAGDIKIDADMLMIQNGTLLSASSFGKGAAGNIDIKAKTSFHMSGVSPLSGEGSALAINSSTHTGGGSITIHAGELLMSDGARIQNLVDDAGNSGKININVQRTLQITGESRNGTSSGIRSRVRDQATSHSSPGIVIAANEILLDTGGTIETMTSGEGNAGNLMIEGGKISLKNGGGIASQTFGSGDAGDITVRVVGELTINGADIHQGSEISSNSVSDEEGTGNAGDITIQADHLHLSRGGALSSTSFGSGNGGTISLNIAKKVVIEGIESFPDGNTRQSGIFTNAQGFTEHAGDAGIIELKAQKMILDDQAIIASSTFDGFGNGGRIELVIEESVYIGENARISADSFGFGEAGDITLETKELTIVAGGSILSDTFFSGNAGNIRIRSEKIDVSGGVFGGNISTISSNSFDEFSDGGNAGNISIQTNELVLDNGGNISSTSFGQGDGGNITINATDSVIMGGSFKLRDSLNITSKIITDTVGFGEISRNAGEITVQTKLLELSDGATISSSAFFSDGKGGKINLDVRGDLTLSDQSLILSITEGAGDAGEISILANKLSLTNQSTISSSTTGFGQGGRISIVANTVALSGTKGSSISSFSLGEITGSSGVIDVSAGTLFLANGSLISTFSLHSSSGNINLRVGNMTLDDSTIESSTLGDAEQTGAITIEAENLTLRGNASINTESRHAGGGDIFLHANVFHASNSEIATSVRLGQGKGGNITIDATRLILRKSKIIANAFGGNGGDITITADHFLPSIDSVIQASSALQTSGTIAILAPELDLQHSITPIHDDFLDGTHLIIEHCARRTDSRDRLLVKQYTELPISPEDLRNPLFFLYP